LRVFNDDTLSPGAIWPLHPHREIEVVTYCAQGEFRHADERGLGGVLKKGWVQHTTVGRGMSHSEINNRADDPMRFIQMWFLPSERGLPPSVEQKQVERPERANKFLPLVSNQDKNALPIHSEARVYSSFLHAGKTIHYLTREGRGVYLYLLEGGPVRINDILLPTLGAAKIAREKKLEITGAKGAEMLLVDMLLI
jgi:redox-sensitive bicupin YhaK (pirin superfamily)